MQRILEIVLQHAPYGSLEGITTEEVAKLSGVMRHNASADLNGLVRQGCVIKKNSRPVRFWAAEENNLRVKGLSVQASAENEIAVSTEITCINEVIGAKGSLKSIIEQAKAAMLYPPKGLPTLIVGSTGVGKSYLTEFMYHYAIQSGRLDPDAPFNVFNCADYAANPQLLIAQLFGFVKGAFTGADKTTPGMIAQSENGILFLDEIHRLPADGQEMLFLLMDRGVYRMVGDGATLRPASITLIAATSEDPHSALLSTMLRRFHVLIKIPDLAVRPLEERLLLIEHFLQEEATRVGVPIVVSPLVLVALLTFHTIGNVGEIRSAILLGCAKSFLNYIASDQKKGMMPLYLTHLSPEIQFGYLQNHRETIKAEKMVDVEDRTYSPVKDMKPKEMHDKVPLDLYRELNQRIKGYLECNLDPFEIQKLIQIDVDYYLRRLLGKASISSQIPSEFLDVVAEFMEEAGKLLGHSFGPDAITGLALHLASAPKTANSDADRTLALVAHCPREYGVVRKLASLLKTKLVISLGPEEISYLALFLHAHGRSTDSGNLTIMVIAHGESTASSMAEVANQLINDKRVLAVDMPLDQSVEDTLQQAIHKVKDCGQSKGILLLVDMGSLTGLGPAIEKATGIPVEVIPLVTTVAVIEAAHLVGQSDMELAGVVQKVKQIYNMEPAILSPSDGKKVIITTCLTGEGTARKLAAFLSEALPEDIKDEVLIQSVNLENGSEIPRLLVEGWKGKVIAVVGTVNPNLPGIPFIGMEQILFGEGIQTLLSHYVQKGGSPEMEESLSTQEAVALASRFIEDSIMTEEGKLFSQAARKALENLEQHLEVALTAGQAARWVIHFAFALERLSTDGLVIECLELLQLEQYQASLLDRIEQAVSPMGQLWNLNIPRSEIGYLALIVLSL
ncbi:MAG TPA: sigma 54-interacting transcriptional regulator [Neobacillus sp.]|jgi:transcriptional regulatory protein LevR/transcriptional regulator with AAA-type ATPase domain